MTPWNQAQMILQVICPLTARSSQLHLFQSFYRTLAPFYNTLRLALLPVGSSAPK